MKKIGKLWIGLVMIALAGMLMQGCGGLVDLKGQTNYTVEIETNFFDSKVSQNVLSKKSSDAVSTLFVTNRYDIYQVLEMTNYTSDQEIVRAVTNEDFFTNYSSFTNEEVETVYGDETPEEVLNERNMKDAEINEDLSVQVLSPEKSTTNGSSVVAVGLSSSEVETVWVAFDGGEFVKANGVNPWTKAVKLSNGDHSVKVFAKDSEGDISYTNTVGFYVDSSYNSNADEGSLKVVSGASSDQEAPEVSVGGNSGTGSAGTLNDGDVVRSSSVTLTGSTSDDAGVAGIYVTIYKVDSEGNKAAVSGYDNVKVTPDENGNWEIYIIGLEVGSYESSITVEDKNYNVSDPVTVDFTVDKEPAEGSIYLNNNDTYTTNTTIVVDNKKDYGWYRAAESESGLSSAEWVSVTDPISYTVSEGTGEKEIYIEYRTTMQPDAAFETNTQSITLVGTVADVTFSGLDSSTVYTSQQTLYLSTPTEGAVIRYTTDGSTPTMTYGNVYDSSSGISIPAYQTTTVKVIAYKGAWVATGVISKTYTVTGRVEDPKYSIDGGTYDHSLDVAISTVTEGATLYYKTSSMRAYEVYSEPVHIQLEGFGVTEIIWAYAVKSDYLSSETNTETYEIETPTGYIDGVVKKATADGSNPPLSGVTVKIYEGDELLEQSTTDTNGKYHYLAKTGSDYRVNFAKEGYVTVNYEDVEVDEDKITYLETVLQVIEPEPEEPQTGAVSGQLSSATSGNYLSGATVNFRSGMNVQEGSIVTTAATDSDGKFNTGSVLQAGNYTMEVKLDGYSTSYYNVTVIPGSTVAASGMSLSPSLPSGQLRIVLSWDDNPVDMDLHMSGPKVDDADKRFHIDSGHKVYFTDGTLAKSGYREDVDSVLNRYNKTENDVIAQLDHDDIDMIYSGDEAGGGPETLTIKQQYDGHRYSIWVHQFSDNPNQYYRQGTIGWYKGLYRSRFGNYDYYNSIKTQDDINESGAVVKIFFGDTLVKTFYPPQSDEIGPIWVVCDVYGSEIIPVQEYVQMNKRADKVSTQYVRDENTGVINLLEDEMNTYITNGYVEKIDWLTNR